jgi:hypothetical protein
MSDEIAAANIGVVRRFYKEVFVHWNLALVDQVVSPQFTSHDWPEGSPTGPQTFRISIQPYGQRYRCPI